MELIDTPLPDVLEHIHLRSLFFNVTFFFYMIGCIY